MPFLNPWAIIGALAAIAVAFGGGYGKGRHDASQAAEVATLTAQVAEARSRVQAAEALADERTREAEAATQIARQTAQDEEQSNSEAATLHQRIDEYARQLATMVPHDGCALSDDDLRSLRSLAGLAPITPSAAEAHPAGRPVGTRKTHPHP